MGRRGRFGPRGGNTEYKKTLMYDTDIATGEITEFTRVTTIKTNPDGTSSYGPTEDLLADNTPYTPAGQEDVAPVLVALPSENLAVTGSTPTQLTPPTHAAYAEVFVEDANVRYTTDASAPADNNGTQMRRGQTIRLKGSTILSDFRVLPIDNVGNLDPTQTANLTVSYANLDPEAGFYATVESLFKEVAALTANTPLPSGDYIYSVDIRGEWAAIGRAYADAGANQSGLVEIWRNTGSGWSHFQDLVAHSVSFGSSSPDPSTNGGFGSSVALAVDVRGKGVDRLWVGESGYVSGSRSAAGRVHLFEWNGTSWQHLEISTGFNVDDSRNFGNAIAANNDGGLLVGAQGSDQFSSNGGEIQFMYLNVSEQFIILEQQIGISGVQTNHYFGTSVALSNTHAAAGTRQPDQNGNRYVYVYEIGGTATDPTINSTPFTIAEPAGNEEFGQQALAFDADRLIVSAHLYDGAAGTNQGRVYVYQLSGSNTWTLVQSLDSPKPIAGGAFGNTLSADQGRLIVGSDANEAYTFEWDGSAYVVRDVISGPGPAPNSSRFAEMALATDGDKALITDRLTIDLKFYEV